MPMKKVENRLFSKFFSNNPYKSFSDMKKILLMAVAAIMATMNMNAQEQGEFSYKTRLGGALSTFTNNSDAKSKLGLEWCFGADYMFTDNFGLSLEIHHEYLGAKYKERGRSRLLDDNR